MTSREFTESLIFERLEPDAGDETVRLLGLLVTLMHNVYRDAHAKPNPFTFDDFVSNPYAPSKREREEAFAGLMASYAENAKRRKAMN
jgi:hypothetical protein